MRWALVLQPYGNRIVAIRGAENVGADYLKKKVREKSRECHNHKP